MRVTSSKTIHITEKELKNIIADWLGERASYDDAYYKLFVNNHCLFEFDEKGNLVVVIDGELEEYNSDKK